MKKIAVWVLLCCLLLIPNQKLSNSDESTLSAALHVTPQKGIPIVIDGVDFYDGDEFSSDGSSVVSDNTAYEIASDETSKSVLSKYIDSGKTISDGKTSNAHSSVPSVNPSLPSSRSSDSDSRKEDDRIAVLQTISGECLTTDGEWIYFADLSNRETLSRVRPDGTDLMSCASIKGVYALNYNDGWLYYWSEDPYASPACLYKCRPDGGEVTKLSTTVGAEHSIIYEGYMYFMEKGTDVIKNKVKNIRKIKIDGTDEREIVSGNYDNITIVADRLFFLSPNGELITSDLDGNDKRKVDIQQKKIVSIYTDGETLYCETTYPETQLGIFDAENNFVQAHIAFYFSRVYIFDNYGYYMIYNNHMRRYEMYKMNLDVVEITRILAFPGKQ